MVETQELISLSVAQDKLSVRLLINPAADPLRSITVGDIHNELHRQGISNGIEQGVIEGAVEFYNEFRDSEDVVIAQGTPPTAGNPGSVTCLMKKPETQVTIDSDGSINFRETNAIARVEKGQPVYRMALPQNGTDGRDIFGNVIKAPVYGEPKFPHVVNTVVNPADPLQLIAAIDGCAVFKNDTVEICSFYLVKGNVDFSTGNIRFDGPVRVLGDVKSGFEIHSGACVTVEGTVEDAIIEAKGDVTVKCGFVGTGKGSITSGNDVKVGYVRNQKIRAGQSIYVSKEAIGSQLIAQRKIYVAGKGLGLAGGYAFAIYGMELAALGSESEVKTLLQLGSDPQIKAQVDGIIAEEVQLSTRSNLLKKQLDEIENSKKKSKALFTNLIEKMELVMEAKMNMDLAVEELKRKKEKIMKETSICLEPIVRVQGDIYPGTVLSFHTIRKLIDEKSQRKMYYLANGEIKESTIVGE